MLRLPSSSDISKLIMPSQNDGDLYREERVDRIENGVHVKVRDIHSTKGATINFSEYFVEPSRSESDTKVIIHAVGNAEMYEHYNDEYIALAKKYPNAKIIGFNFRNVGASTGEVTSDIDWINDVISLVNFCLSKHYQIENICLVGASLGACILTLAAARIYEANKESCVKKGIDIAHAKSVRLLNIRSFNSLADEVVNSIIPMILDNQFYTGPLKILARPVVTALIATKFGRMNAAEAFRSLPDEVKDYIVAIDDELINKGSRLHDSLKLDNHSKKCAIKAQMKEYEQAQVSDEYADEIRDLELALLNLYDSKVTFRQDRGLSIDAHNVSLEHLRTCHRHRDDAYESELPAHISGQAVFESKLNRLLAR